MTAYNCDQDYFDPAGVPDWATADTSKVGWKPWGGVIEYFMNKVWDPFGSGQWVNWETSGTPDPSGTYYPDPYGSGYGACTFYRLVSKRFA